MPLNCERRGSIASITSDVEPFDLKDVAFKIQRAPLKIDLSDAAHAQRPPQETTDRISSCCSTRSTEFQKVMDSFNNMKINKESEKSKTIDEKRSLHKRRHSTKLTSGGLVADLRQGPQRVRRKSLPSLGLAAVDIKCSVPTKITNSQSFTSDMSRRVRMGRNDLTKIPEFSKKEARRHSLISEAASKMASKDERRFPRGRRFSLDVQQNASASNNSLHRRSSCHKIAESPSKWCVKVHQRTLDIDDDDKLFPHSQTRRASFAGLPSLSRESHARAGLLPRIGRRNTIMQW